MSRRLDCGSCKFSRDFSFVFSADPEVYITCKENNQDHLCDEKWENEIFKYLSNFFHDDYLLTIHYHGKDAMAAIYHIVAFYIIK